MQYETIACTGGNGALGKVLVSRLRSHSQVTVVDIVPPVTDVDYVAADILDLEALTKAFAGKDAVVHLAAISNPRINTQENTFRVNTQGTWAVMQAAENAGVRRVVLASSDSTTGLLYNPADWAPQYLPVDEDHPLRPSEAYSLSKQVTEVIARSFAARGTLDVVLIRPSHIIFPEEYGVLEAKGADVSNYHLWTYVAPEDVAQGFQLALELKDIRYDTFFITAADGLNQRPTLEMLSERYRSLPEIRKPEIFERDPCASVLDISRAREWLGYQPTTHWREMVARITAATAS